jgi:hypothetical protein
MSAAETVEQAPDEQVADWPYRFEVLNVDHLVVDHAYQRPLTTFVTRIAEKWDPALVGTLVTSERGDDEYAVVDGQTRLEAARLKGVTDLPCLVYMGLSQADEASLFARLQKERKGIASFHRFRAARVAGEEEPIAITKIVEACGYEVGVNGQQQYEITAVAALEKVYRKGPDLLERCLTILKEGMPSQVPSGDLIRGLAYYIGQNKQMDDERMAEKLKNVTVEELKRRASALKEGAGTGGGSDKYMAGALDGVYRRR